MRTLEPIKDYLNLRGITGTISGTTGTSVYTHHAPKGDNALIKIIDAEPRSNDGVNDYVQEVISISVVRTFDDDGSLTALENTMNFIKENIIGLEFTGWNDANLRMIRGTLNRDEGFETIDETNQMEWVGFFQIDALEQ